MSAKTAKAPASTAAAGRRPNKRLMMTEVRAIDAERRTITAYASTPTIDRYDTIFDVDAFRGSIDRYMANPVVLGGHNTWYESGEAPVIGRTISADLDESGLLVTIEFAQGGVAETWWARYRDGFMRALSVGVYVMGSEQRKVDGRTIMVFTSVDLLEISCVAVPGNPEALVRAIMDEHDLDTSAKVTRAICANDPEPPDASESSDSDTAFADLRAAVAALDRRLSEVRRDIDLVLTARSAAAHAPATTPKYPPRDRRAGAEHGRSAAGLGGLL